MNTDNTEKRTLLTKIPHVVAPKVNLPERWSDVRGIADMPARYYTGDLKEFQKEKTGWRALYARDGFRFSLECKDGQIHQAESHSGHDFYLAAFPSDLPIKKTALYRAQPNQEWETSIQKEWLDLGIHFLTNKGDNVFTFIPDGTLISVVFVLPFHRLVDFGKLHRYWSTERKFTMGGWYWLDHFVVSYREGRCGEKLGTREGIRERLIGYLPTEEIVREGNEDRALTARQRGVVVCLDVFQREVGALARDLAACGFIECSHESERFAIAGYATDVPQFRSVRIFTPDKSRRLFLARIAPGVKEALEHQESPGDFYEKLEMLEEEGINTILGRPKE